MKNSTTIGKDKVSQIGLQITGERGSILFSTTKRVQLKKKPVSQINFEDIGAVEATIEKLLHLRAIMKKRGFPDNQRMEKMPNIMEILRSSSVEVHMVGIKPGGEIEMDGSPEELEARLGELIGKENASGLIDLLKKHIKPEKKEEVKETVS